MIVNRIKPIFDINKKKGNATRFKPSAKQMKFPKTNALQRVSEIAKGRLLDAKA